MTCNSVHGIVLDVLCPKTSTEEKKTITLVLLAQFSRLWLHRYVHVNQIGQAYSFAVICALILLRNNYTKDILAILGIDLI